MTDNLLTLFCLADGDSMPFSVEIAASKTVDHLKDAIKTKIPDTFKGVDAKDLTLWCVSVPLAPKKDRKVISLGDIPLKEELDETDDLSEVFPDKLPKKTIHIIVLRHPPDLLLSTITFPKRDQRLMLDLPANKKIRLTERWRRYTASDGTAVDLPPSWIKILASTEFVPDPRAAFDHLKGDLRAGDKITIPSMGQVPKNFGLHGQGHGLFVTEQMLEIWEDMRGDQEFTYRRVLSGPMGVGKSYLSYFLAARAYAEGWIILYMADAGLLNTEYEDELALDIVKRFLALNKDILTGAELGMLVNEYSGTRNISKNALSVMFDSLLKSRDRKTLLLVDEHRKLFEQEPYVPDKFKLLVPLQSYHWWGEEPKGSRVVFTGTSHAKYEMNVLEDCYRQTSVVFVGPLSRHVFSKLLDTYPRLAAPVIREEVTTITNCVPQELVYLSAAVEYLPDPITMNDLQQEVERRTKDFLVTAKTYYKSRTPFRIYGFYKALLETFLGCTSIFNFESDFLDLGLIYRSKDVGRFRTQHRILCRPAQRALLELFKTLPLPKDTKRRIYDGSLSRDDLETALCHQLICTTKPIVLNATDLNGSSPTTIALNFSHCDTLQIGRTTLGSVHQSVLTRVYKGYPQFDFVLGPLFIQTSISDFEHHNTDSADLSKAFNVRDNDGTNQIEHCLNNLFGPGHSARIEDNRFVVTKDGVPVPGFRVVYIRGSPESHSPNSQLVVSADSDKTARVLDASTGALILTLSSHNAAMRDVAFSPNGLQIASGGDDMKFPEAVSVTAVEFSPDGDQIAAVVGEGNVQVWDRRTCAVGPVFKAEPWRLLNAVYSPCGRLVAAFSGIYCFRLWDLHNTTVKEHHVFVTLEGNGCFERRSVTFSYAGNQLAIGFDDGSNHIFDPQSGDPTSHRRRRQLDYLWDVQSQEPCIKLVGHSASVQSIAYSPCGQWIASGSENRTVRLRHRRREDEAECWQSAVVVQSLFGRYLNVAWNPILPMEFVTNCEDQSVRAWRILLDGENVVVKMLWGFNVGALCAEGLASKDAVYLSPVNQNLLVQRGAVDSSLVPEGEGLDT
ncbi:hypothetical protein BKA57DRAFT_499820 [Linnemannia elongata]|nr:hypothetical protein BKA57DRAFT_499820 [Linnemannia elongata]